MNKILCVEDKIETNHRSLCIVCHCKPLTHDNEIMRPSTGVPFLCQTGKLAIGGKKVMSLRIFFQRTAINVFLAPQSLVFSLLAGLLSFRLQYMECVSGKNLALNEHA